MTEFLAEQAEKYRCPNCGDFVSVHDGKCYSFGYTTKILNQKVLRKQDNYQPKSSEPLIELDERKSA